MTMRRAIASAVAALAIVTGLTAAPAHAVCNDDPNQCARIVHSVNSDVARISVSRVWPVKAGYIESLARGTAGTYAGVYVPLCYQALLYLPGGTYIWIPGWHSVYSGNSSYVVDIQWMGGTGC